MNCIILPLLFVEQHYERLFAATWILTVTAVSATKCSLVVRCATEIKSDAVLEENQFCTMLGFLVGRHLSCVM